MNVMKVAHQQARLVLVERPNLGYRLAFRLSMIEAHKVNKQMKEREAAKLQAIAHFEGCIKSTLEVLETVGINDYYIALCNNEKLQDYTLLRHKVEGDTSSPLGWANYRQAIRTHGKQADQYVIAYPTTVKLHAQTHLLKTVEYLAEQVAMIKAK
jgi:hypothetical protein